MKSYYKSPIGPLEITASDDALQSVRFLSSDSKDAADDKNAIIDSTIEQLSRYFKGELTKFSIPLQPEGTDFEQEVWQQLQHIPYGQTGSYGQLAKKLGDPKKVRAVGRANGQNPIPIIIPCHRVIGSGGNLTGYAGGIERKRWLLQHEGALLL